MFSIQNRGEENDRHFYIWITLLLLILSVIGIFRTGDKGSEIISRSGTKCKNN